jgi:ubiquinone/menaquinone biosynthesis C-methylase UbiE
MLETLACPVCKKPLANSGGSYTCADCNTLCQERSEFLDFLQDTDVYWGEISPAEMARTLELAGSEGWREALLEVAQHYPDLAQYLLSNGRIDWLFHCLNPSKTGKCLDVGSGWGANTFGLAEYFSEVWSLEAVKERLEFQAIRRTQEGRKNIRLVRSDWLRLPFADNSFDLVVSNGVLEWIGLSDYTRGPRSLQLDFLREVRRVLKEDGCLYVGIENRLGIQNFTGTRDHSGLRFTSLLPRFAADFVVRVKGKRLRGYSRERRVRERWHDYRTYTYTLWGYKSLLREAGFGDIDAYWTNSYNLPRYSGKFDSYSYPFYAKKVKQRTSGVSSKKPGTSVGRIAGLIPAPALRVLNQWFSPAFLLYAYKDTKRESFEDQLLADTDNTSSFVKVSGGHGIFSKVTYLITKKGDLDRVAKIPRFPSGRMRLEAEESSMSMFTGMAVRRSEVDGLSVFIEQPIRGTQIDPVNRIHSEMAVNWLIKFQEKTEKGWLDYSNLREEAASFDDVVRKMHLDKKTDSRTRDTLTEFMSDLERAHLKTCAEHGDFFFGNIMLNDSGEIAVTDWEYSREEGMPLFDLVFFLLSSSTLGSDPSRLTGCRLGSDDDSPILMNELKRYSRIRGIDENLILKSVPYVVLRAVARESAGKNHNQLRLEFYRDLLTIWLDGDEG